MILLAGIVVAATGLWLIGMAVLVIVSPLRAEQFLRQFARSPGAHYTEQLLRLIAGSGILFLYPAMKFSVLFMYFGWIIVGTSAVLLVLPWRWHHRFAQWAIPLAVSHKRLYALGSFLLGGFLLYSMVPA